jgi:hypothetical protein
MLAPLIAATVSRVKMSRKHLQNPYLVGKKRRMASVLVISNSTDPEKAIVVNSECELCTTSAGGTL